MNLIFSVSERSYDDLAQAASSSLADLEPGTRFKPVLPDPLHLEQATKSKRVIMLSGKIYYDLVKERHSRGLDDRVTFIRIEELSPFPFSELQEALKEYTSADEFFWLQEEPRNQGAYTHVWSRIDNVLAGLGHTARVGYKGRKENSMPAPGIGKIYAAQQSAVIRSAFEGL